MADFSSFGSSLDLKSALVAGFPGFSAIPSSYWVLRSFVFSSGFSVGVFISAHVPCAKSVLSFYSFGNPDIRVPSDVGGVSVVMTPRRGVVCDGESGRRSRFSAASSRNIQQPATGSYNKAA
ncbi:hypothetical protein NDU88_002382 [Pleurodeles waltl]|uniref:Uncharacterized protein n=1 Tax=Pleurodeles waltl TaxID=8319 RepID=A0AAV7TLM4_PLEWA|nr:hypothetical protein NDU88_002382 [Pleurodeles waltl]